MTRCMFYKSDDDREKLLKERDYLLRRLYTIEQELLNPEVRQITIYVQEFTD